MSNIKKVYISLKIVFFLLKYLNYNLYTSYLIALIKVIKPKIIITTIDNSWKFHEIAKTLSKSVRDNLKKLTVSIQGESIRITGKNKDQLLLLSFHKLIG